MRYKFLSGVAAIVFAAAGTFMGSAEAHADASADFPTCVRVPLGGGQVRLYVDPNNVVKGDVREVRTSQTQFTERSDGTWTGVVPATTDHGWHFVFKSNAKLFSERRFSVWVECGRKNS